MLRRRSSISFTSSSKLRDRQLKFTFSKAIHYGKFLAIISLVVGIIIVALNFLTIKNIVCNTNEGPCPVEFENLLGFVKGKNILTLKQKDIKTTFKNFYPIDDLKCSFIFPNKLSIEIIGWQSFIPANTYQVVSFPALSMDIAYLSSESANWVKPSREVKEFIANMDHKGQRLWSAGLLTPEEVDGNNLVLIYNSNPTEEMLKDFYRLTLLANKYLEKPEILVIGSRVLLSQESLPDIIINVPADLGEVESALQSLDYLYTIKEDAKVIDLSFKHPIIK